MAGRAALQYFEILLANRWQSDISGRIEEVPEPSVIIAGDEDTTRVNFQNDQIFVRDGGPQGLTPKGAGWGHEESETLVTLDIRTTQSRGRLEGFRDENNESERYGGLRGETKRILDSVRKGDKEYDLIEGFEWNDLSEEVGFGNWRGEWEVRVTQHASNIDPQP